MITLIATHQNMSNKLISPLLVSMTAILLGGCASAVNTAGSADFACPGMPMGVTCKTPGAVYKSTNQDLPVTDFDTPLGTTAIGKPVGAPGSIESIQQAASMAKQGQTYVLPKTVSVERKSQGPKPVREPAKVMRVWIAPWVATDDTLHLAQVHYTEIVPRTWTVGKPESKNGAGYVIPHLAFDSISQVGNPEPQNQRNVRPEQRASDANAPANAQIVPTAAQ
jgi:conjugal transfer pilus assembly protein TraV